MKEKPATCAGPECNRPAVAFGLCSSHYGQKHRGQPLRPLKLEPGVRIQVRVLKTTAVELEKVGPTAGLAAQKVLNAWADRKR
jgi:hypothetical protein